MLIVKYFIAFWKALYLLTNHVPLSFDHGWRLTYMSIDVLIKDRVRRGMLFPVLPRTRGSAPRRALFVVEKVWNILASPTGDDEWEQRVAELQADLEIFVEGMRIGPKYLFLLYPAADCVWEIRSVDKSPSIRVLGLFAARDVFIATDVVLREELGGWQSREWKQVKRNARAAWRNICLTYQPMMGTNVRRFVSGAVDGRYFKGDASP